MAHQEDSKPQLSTDIHRIDTAVTIPEKAALSNVTTVCATPSKSARSSADFTPKTDKSGSPFDTDLEAMIPTNESRPGCPRRSNTHRRSDCQVWPGRAEWEKKARAAKARRKFNCLAGLSKRNRIIVKIVIVLLIVGIAVGVGFGVSKPLGAPIWGDDD